MFLVVFVGFIIALFYSKTILFTLTSQLLQIDANFKLIVLSPIEGFMTNLKISFWVSLVLTSPISLFFVFQFVRPALYSHEKRIVAPFILLSYLSLLAGIYCAHTLTIPFASAYFYAFNASFAENLWSVSSFVSFTLFVMVANAMAFEIGLILLMLVHYGQLTESFLVSKRRIFIVLAFILGALLTPPDVPSQLVMASCLILFYEMAILYAKLKGVKACQAQKS